MSTTAHERAHVVLLWLAMAAARALAALPVTQPRIFRDELVHWQLARSFVTHRPFLISGEVVDYPAVLYPAVLSLGLHLSDLHLGFHVAQVLGALMMSGVVLSTYALAREIAGHRDALAAAALAALVPAGGYSVFIMEENLYYPLFVASCWLGWRVVVHGRARDAAWCAVALGLTYFAKPLAVPLVAAYAGVALLWMLAEWRSGSRDARSTVGALAIRLAPAAAFGAMLVVRHALTSHAGGADAGAGQSGMVLGRFYTDELGGALVPPLKPFAAIVLSLGLAFGFGVGVAPVAALLDGWRARIADRPRLWLALLAIAVAAVYVLAAARHNLVINRGPKIHERYVFAVAPLFLVLFVAEGARPSRRAVAVACVAIAVVLARIADTALPENTWPNAPSLTLAWLVHTRLRSNLVLGALAGAAAAAVCLAARALARGGRARGAVAIGSALVILNASWYAFVHRIQRDVAPVAATVRALERLAPAGARVATVVSRDADPMAALSYYGKFWMEERLIVYWTGDSKRAWYADSAGAPADAARRTGAAHLVGLPGVAASCPAGTRLPPLGEGVLPVEIVVVPAAGCGAGDRVEGVTR